jgi:hypothetical protein
MLENRPFKEEEDKRDAGIMEGMSYDEDDESSFDMLSESSCKGQTSVVTGLSRQPDHDHGPPRIVHHIMPHYKQP